MKLAAFALLVFIQVGCSDSGREDVRAEVAHDSPVEWTEGIMTLDEYRDANPGRRIFAFFTMESFDLVGQLLERALNENVKVVFPAEDFLFLKFDCADRDSLGIHELEKLNLTYMPVFVASHGVKWDATSNTNDYDDLQEGFIAELKSLVR